MNIETFNGEISSEGRFLVEKQNKQLKINLFVIAPIFIIVCLFTAYAKPISGANKLLPFIFWSIVIVIYAWKVMGMSLKLSLKIRKVIERCEYSNEAIYIQCFGSLGFPAKVITLKVTDITLENADEMLFGSDIILINSSQKSYIFLDSYFSKKLRSLITALDNSFSENATIVENFQNVWYLPDENTWRNFQFKAMKDIGNLSIRKDCITYNGYNYKIIIEKTINLSIVKQGRDFMNNWVKIEYENQNHETKTAFFADGNNHGWSGIMGGTTRIYNSLKSTSQF